MDRSKIISVIVIDDSEFSREIISRGISRDPRIQVVAKAEDPFDARDKILKHKPDVLTLDINMPKMDGITFLKKLMAQYPIPTVAISGSERNLLEAVESGAVDFVKKPEVKSKDDLQNFIDHVIEKVKVASNAELGKVTEDKAIKKKSTIDRSQRIKSNIKLIAFGASTGGTDAFVKVLESLPKGLPGMVLVQHMPPVFTKMYAQRLDSISDIEVMEAKTGDEILPGRLLVAPGEYHMEVYQEKGKYYVRCKRGEKVSGHCPSVDVLFESVAKELGKRSIGVILTGMGRDGASGLLSMKNSGAYTIGQDRQTSVVYGMPMVAYNIGAVERQLPIEKIGQDIVESVKAK